MAFSIDLIALKKWMGLLTNVIVVLYSILPTWKSILQNTEPYIIDFEFENDRLHEHLTV